MKNPITGERITGFDCAAAGAAAVFGFGIGWVAAANLMIGYLLVDAVLAHLRAREGRSIT